MPAPVDSRVPDSGGDAGNSTVIDQASEWLVKLWSGTATAADLQGCARWRAAHADHERVWQQLQAIEHEFEAIPPRIGEKVLRSSARGRRRTLKMFAALLTGGAAAYAVPRTSLWRRYTGDYHTGIGESRTVTLADATRVTLNTASAIDVRYDERQRTLWLQAGEILVAPATDSAAVARPFSVVTAQGLVRSNSPRFSVRQIDETVSRVAVFEGAVAIESRNSPDPPARLEAGQQASFSARGLYGLSAADQDGAAWSRGLLIVERMRLDVFVGELARYRPGVVRCDPSVGHLLLTGVYALSDTDRILSSVAKALPISIAYHTPYWVTVTAA